MDFKYQLHFHQTGCPIIITDIVFQPNNYGQFDFRVIQEGDEITGYLSQKGIEQTRHFGLCLLNKKFSSQILKRLRTLLKELKNKELLKKLKKIDKNNLIRRWEELENLTNRVIHSYRYCEHPVLAPLEDVVLKTCPDQDNLVKILKNPKLAENLGFKQKEKEALDLLVQLGRLKFDIHNNFDSLFEEVYKFGKKLAKKYNLSLKEALSLRSSEIEILLKKRKLPKIKTLNRRLKGAVFIPSKKKKEWRLLTGKDYFLWKKRLELKSVSRIKGISVYPGKVKGVVKIYLETIKSIRLPSDSILIAGMTNPQIVPFLKNVKAIITDEGGLTCHAAIISRELKIPCIIGTRSATKVLKDGDLVEVDANKGIVKKLK